MDEKWKLSKSYSTKTTSTAAASSTTKSSSLRGGGSGASTSGGGGSPPSITRKCSKMAKEHKARFYIVKRCVAMLVCWHKHGGER
ncbi:Small polypeptide DEVIL 18 [Linum grandiflorum]